MNIFYRTYSVICTSSSGSTLTKQTKDDAAENGTTTFSDVFTTADGVQTGTPYECAVKMAIDSGQVSAKSEPAVFITPDAGVFYLKVKRVVMTVVNMS